MRGAIGKELNGKGSIEVELWLIVGDGQPGVGIHQKGLVLSGHVEECEGVVGSHGEVVETVGVLYCLEKSVVGCDWVQQQS